MRVLHINTVQKGGAAWCAIRINQSLVHNGIDSRMLFAMGKDLPVGVDGAIAEPDKNWWRSVPIIRGIFNRLLLCMPFFMNWRKLQKLLDKANENHLYLHHPLSNYKSISNHPLVEWADIIHLHLVPDFVDYPTFFKEVKKPIVWTLHDKFPAVGVQHYCSEFYPVPGRLKSIDSYAVRIKRKSVTKSNNLHLVAISKRMIDVCKNSEVLKGFPVTLIYNGVDTSVFHQYDKLKTRMELGVFSDATIFLFSSYNIHDMNKGLDRVIGAMEKVRVSNKMHICIGGSNVSPDASFPVILTGMSNQYFSSRGFIIK